MPDIISMINFFLLLFHVLPTKPPFSFLCTDRCFISVSSVIINSEYPFQCTVSASPPVSQGAVQDATLSVPEWGCHCLRQTASQSVPAMKYSAVSAHLLASSPLNEAAVLNLSITASSPFLFFHGGNASLSVSLFSSLFLMSTPSVTLTNSHQILLLVSVVCVLVLISVAAHCVHVA